MKKVVENTDEKLVGKLELTLAGIFLVIGIVFYLMLNTVVSPLLSPDSNVDLSFGFGEILFSISFALIFSGILIWTKSLSIKNAYLGVGIGIVIMFVTGYAFSLRFKGFYSTGFMIVIGLVVVGYLGMNFFRYRKDDKYIEGEFDDS